MATPPVLRVVEREARVFSRLWRGVVFSLFLNPVLFLAAMGLGLGGLVNEHTGNGRGRHLPRSTSRPACSWSRARCRSRRASRCGRCSAAVKWVKNFHATVATSITPSQVARRLRAVDRAARHARRDRVPGRRAAARRDPVGVGDPRDPDRRRSARRRSARRSPRSPWPKTATSRSRSSCASVCCRSSCSRARSSRSRSCPSGCRRSR